MSEVHFYRSIVFGEGSKNGLRQTPSFMELLLQPALLFNCESFPIKLLTMCQLW